MKPLTSHQLAFGSANESLAAQGLVPFLKAHAPGISAKSMHFKGLVCKKSEPWVASSVDTLLVFSLANQEIEHLRCACVEIKTGTTAKTLKRATERAEKKGKYNEVDLMFTRANRVLEAAEKSKQTLFEALIPIT